MWNSITTNKNIIEELWGRRSAAEHLQGDFHWWRFGGNQLEHTAYKHTQARSVSGSPIMKEKKLLLSDFWVVTWLQHQETVKKRIPLQVSLLQGLFSHLRSQHKGGSRTCISNNLTQWSSRRRCVRCIRWWCGTVGHWNTKLFLILHQWLTVRVNKRLTWYTGATTLTEQKSPRFDSDIWRNVSSSTVFYQLK